MYDRTISSWALEEVAGLNTAFLSLVTAGPDAAIRFGIGMDIAMRISLLENDRLLRLAGMPFSLFSIRLHDVTTWEAVLDCRVCDAATAPCWSQEGSSEQQFLIVALGGIRDIARRDIHWASVLFGAHPELARGIAGIEIARLPALADSARSWLRARLAGHYVWWDTLIVSASQGASHRGARELGIHKTMQRALNLGDARLPRGRICRRR